jgi:pilus assembly protein CpaE
MSNTKIRALVALDPEADRQAMQTALALDPYVETVGVADEASSWRALQNAAADVLIVACGGTSESALALVGEASIAHPHRPVVVLYPGAANGFVSKAFEAGADDIVSVGGDGIVVNDAAEQVLFSIEKAIARRRGFAARESAGLGSMICVLGPKGGTGKTLISVNLAVALAQMGQRTVLIDLDLQFGDIGLAMGLRPEHTVYDLVTSSGSLDEEKLEAFLVEHDSGVRALLAPTRPDQESAVTPEFMRELYAVLRTGNDFVIVDTPPGFTPEVISCIDASTDICLVGTLDALSLKNLKLGFETLRLMGYDSEHVRMVLNRANSRVGVSRDDAAMIVGRNADAFVPSHRDVTRSLNEGNPIVAAAHRSDAARAFDHLARLYVSDREPAATVSSAERRKLFGRSAV